MQHYCKVCSERTSGIAGRTIPADDKITRSSAKVFGQADGRHRKVRKTVGAVTFRAVEVDMSIVRIGTVTIVRAERIFCAAAFIMYLMHKPVLFELSECPVQGDAVGAFKMFFQISKAYSGIPANQKLQDKQTHCRGLDIPVQKFSIEIVFFFHERVNFRALRMDIMNKPVNCLYKQIKYTNRLAVCRPAEIFKFV